METTMGTDDHIIAQFTQMNTRLDTINTSIQDTNWELGKVQGVQKSQWGAIKRVEGQMKNITNHYDTCPAFERLESLREATGAIETDVALLQSKTTSKAPAPRRGIVWRDVFTSWNVKLMLLIVLALIALLAGVSIPFQLLGG